MMSKNVKIKGLKNLEKKLSQDINKVAKDKAIEVLKTKGIEIKCPFCKTDFLAKALTVTCPECSKTIDVEFNVG